MTLYLYTHAACLAHVTPPGHPERVDRLRAIEAALASIDGIERVEAPMGRREDVLRCHPAAYFDRIAAAIPDVGQVALDADTHVSPGSLEAAMRAVGGMTAAVDAVVNGSAGSAFVAARPPGHHAERETAMGFCLFGTAAIGAIHALEHHGLARVAVIDFDVHHGNGTQDLLWNEPRTMFASTHQMPLYPGSGAPGETGAHGTIFNHPLAPETGGAVMRTAYEEHVLPAVAAFQPELLIVSAGFDAHADDPLAHLHWSTDDFAWLTRRLCDLADEVCGGRIVSTLEGGYDLDALGASVAAHVTVLKEHAS